MFRRSMFAAVVICIALLAVGTYAQSTNDRTRELVAALDKTKYKKKEKRNISIEFYIDIKNEAAVKTDPSAYWGVYQAEGYKLSLTVGKDGTATGTGRDMMEGGDSVANFTLRNARVDGALLTGTKVYENGQTQSFEAVFTNRTVSTGTSPTQIASRDTLFGLGFIQAQGDLTNRVFLEAAR